MNFIGDMEVRNLQVELKYCERCGGLWLRIQGSSGIYCASCRVSVEGRSNSNIDEVPLRKTARRQVRLPGAPKGMKRAAGRRGGTRVESLRGVAANGVRA
jgi:hypothetical protein